MATVELYAVGAESVRTSSNRFNREFCIFLSSSVADPNRALEDASCSGKMYVRSPTNYQVYADVQKFNKYYWYLWYSRPAPVPDTLSQDTRRLLSPTFHTPPP